MIDAINSIVPDLVYRRAAKKSFISCAHSPDSTPLDRVAFW
jgi:hypothetical protein